MCTEQPVLFRKLAAKALDEGIQKFVAGGVIAHNHTVLLLKRKSSDFMPGIYELPSGGVAKSETIGDGLIKEILEETGLEVESVGRYLGHFDYLSGSGKKTRQFNFVVTVKSAENIELTEHDDYVWCEKENLDDYDVTEQTKEVLLKYFEG